MYVINYNNNEKLCRSFVEANAQENYITTNHNIAPTLYTILQIHFIILPQ